VKEFVGRHAPRLLDVPRPNPGRRRPGLGRGTGFCHRLLLVPSIPGVCTPGYNMDRSGLFGLPPINETETIALAWQYQLFTTPASPSPNHSRSISGEESLTQSRKEVPEKRRR
jgi:hypothetical protein